MTFQAMNGFFLRFLLSLARENVVGKSIESMESYKKDGVNMIIDLCNIISMTKANQNFSKVARMVDANGAAVILKNNAPKYVIIDYDKLWQETGDRNITVEEASIQFISRHQELIKNW